jgi:hypothetical protein
VSKDKRAAKARRGQLLSNTESILLVLEFNIFLYFHNKGLDQKHAQKLMEIRYQFLLSPPKEILA